MITALPITHVVGNRTVVAGSLNADASPPRPQFESAGRHPDRTLNQGSQMIHIHNETGSDWRFHAGESDSVLVPTGESTFHTMPAAALAALQAYGNATGTFIVTVTQAPKES